MTRSFFLFCFFLLESEISQAYSHSYIEILYSALTCLWQCLSAWLTWHLGVAIHEHLKVYHDQISEIKKLKGHFHLYYYGLHPVVRPGALCSAAINLSVCPFISLSHTLSSKWCILCLLLLQNTNRKPYAGTWTLWLVWPCGHPQPLEVAEMVIKPLLASLQKPLLGGCTIDMPRWTAVSRGYIVLRHDTLLSHFP